MEWLSDLIRNDSVAHTVLLYCVIIILGVFLGKRKIFGVSLGITFVLFAGIAIGHFGFSANQHVIDFLRDFGLILFVFFIGLQVGPGFFSSFRKGGLSLNLIALVIVLLGAVTTITIHYATGTSMPMLAGIMSGAVTNTPGLGAAQTALSQLMEKSPGAVVPEISLGYAIAYPFGILGVILSMIFIKRIFRIDLAEEIAAFEEELHPSDTIPEKASILVSNPDVFNRSILEISKSLKPGVVISRILQNGNLHAATSETIVRENDIVLVVAQRILLEEVVGIFGTLSSMDLASGPGRLVSRRILVTNGDVVGRSLGSLKLRTLYNINITRVHRSDIEFIASPGLRIQMGDRLTVVGEEKSVMIVADQLGNSLRRLKEPNVIPLFTGILLGVVLGSIPFSIPGVSHPIKLGLAGGPLIVAILISRFGYKISLISYTTSSVNLMLREIGIVLFLASVGLNSGGKFVPAIVSGEGFVWMGYGALITLLPLLLTGILTRAVLKKNYLELCGLLSGSMTDPPALAYANSIAQSEAPSIAYATVYPLTMFLRIFIAQILILAF